MCESPTNITVIVTENRIIAAFFAVLPPAKRSAGLEGVEGICGEGGGDGDDSDDVVVDDE